MRSSRLLLIPALALVLTCPAAAQTTSPGVPSAPSQLSPLAPSGAPAQATQTTSPGVPSAPSQLTPQSRPGYPAQATQTTQPGVPSQPSQLTLPGQTAPSAQPGFTTPLYRNANVARTLGLSPQQVQLLNEATTRLQSTYGSRLGQFGTLSQADRAARTQELMGQYNAQWNQAAANVLNERQLTRYGQLDLQSRGLEAFNDATVQQRLNLTAPQRQQLQNLRTSAAQQAQQYMQVRWQNSDVAAHLADIYQRQWSDTANGILQPSQRTLWSEMTGQTGTTP